MTKSEIEKALKKGILIKGVESVKKALLKGELAKVIVSKNNQKAFEELKLLSIKTPVELSELTSKEQGILCKKPYAISVIGIKKESKSGVKKR